MSYGLMVYTVALDKVVAACGSGDDKLRRMICGRFRRDLQQSAEWFADEIEHQGMPSPFDAVRALVMGEEMTGWGAAYAYAFKTIVEHFGRHLSNQEFYPFRGEWLEQVDAALAEAGAPAGLETSRLQYGSVPVDFPPPDDFPGFGHWPADLVAEAHAALPDTITTGADADVTRAANEARGWLATAAGRGEAIVGFYH